MYPIQLQFFQITNMNVGVPLNQKILNKLTTIVCKCNGQRLHVMYRLMSRVKAPACATSQLYAKHVLITSVVKTNPDLEHRSVLET